MEKNIWIINTNRIELLDAQKKINANGGMRAYCMISQEAVCNAIKRAEKETVAANRPSLILLDYFTSEQNEEILEILQTNSAYAGVPLIFMIDERTQETDEYCYNKGATIVVRKPLSDAAITRIERMAWQYEQSRNYENILHRQHDELTAAKEIKKLNEQLEKRNKLLRQIFGRYFSDEVVEVILDNPSGATIGGDKRNLVVMMLDLRGFTSISESLSAEQVTDMINHFLEKMTDIIFEYNGSVIEFIGDAILAVFGAPVESEHPEEDAVAAAIEMQNAMHLVNEYNIENNYPHIEMGIGIHKGEVFIGNIGSERMMRYNIIGNAVNLCSRIESYSVGGQILLSDKIVEALDKKCLLKINYSLEISTKGIEQKLRVYQASGISGHYNLQLCHMEIEELKPVTLEIMVDIQCVRDKEIDENIITGKLVKISAKRACFLILKKDVPDLFTDIKADAYMKNGNRIFTGMYAKVVEMEGEFITVHFTNLTDGYMELYRQCFRLKGGQDA